MIMIVNNIHNGQPLGQDVICLPGQCSLEWGHAPSLPYQLSPSAIADLASSMQKVWLRPGKRVESIDRRSVGRKKPGCYRGVVFYSRGLTV